MRIWTIYVVANNSLEIFRLYGDVLFWCGHAFGSHVNLFFSCREGTWTNFLDALVPELNGSILCAPVQTAVKHIPSVRASFPDQEATIFRGAAGLGRPVGLRPVLVRPWACCDEMARMGGPHCYMGRRDHPLVACGRLCKHYNEIRLLNAAEYNRIYSVWS